MTALIGMAILTHAYAEESKTPSVTPEVIGRLYLDEARFPGATLQCYQAGREIVREPGLRNLRITDDDITALRLDGATIRILPLRNGAQALCTVINRPDPDHGE